VSYTKDNDDPYEQYIVHNCYNDEPYLVSLFYICDIHVDLMVLEVALDRELLQLVVEEVGLAIYC
jgi:hypothetical protein